MSEPMRPEPVEGRASTGSAHMSAPAGVGRVTVESNLEVATIRPRPDPKVLVRGGSSSRPSGAQRDRGLAQLAAPVVPGGPSSTVGTYSNSWSPPSKVRLSTRSSLMSGYPS